MNREQLAEFPYWPHLITLIIIALAFLGYRYFAYYDTRSNDSYVSANVINMASLVSGPISVLYVQENQSVKKGDKLIEIDPRPYLYALNKARASLNLAKIHYENKKLAIKIAEEKLKQRQAFLSLSQDYFKRFSKLTKEGALAEIQLVNVIAQIKEHEATVLAAAHNLRIARQNFDDNEVKAAQAIYDKALYLYRNTTIVAPTDGLITNFNLRVGQYIKTGEWLFAFIDTQQWWVETRYRETAIRLIKPGDKAKIWLDMYPGKTFHGHVKSIGWGINRVQSQGVAPSSLVYMEPTEDWIRIAQRFPVRIYIDDISPDYPLRIGASATTVTYR
ncbi:hemolysin D [Legionella busanensis]|uniref:Hemolysin D n=1 Tax=Legionella busanensis TaxID=190655 RepID=A0A378JHW8_9GAMM|nr:efflux RND transporter periplasmic adaptor subunit [Legionella busanensis]STX50734.1 hemolysin D [Legionella busanensis]